MLRISITFLNILKETWFDNGQVKTKPMKNLLTQIVQALVDNPEELQINEIEGMIQ